MRKRSCLFLLSSVASSSWQNIEAFSTLTKASSTGPIKKYQPQENIPSKSCLLFNDQRIKRVSSTYRVDSARYVQSDSYQFVNPTNFRKGDLIQVEVVSFGRLGASVEIIAHKSHEEKDLIDEYDEPLGYGLILQSEIGYFRSSRRGVDVVRGETLPAYVDWVREDGKVNITLRKPGGRGKAEDLGKIVMEKLQESSNNEIPIGDKSTPGEINEFLPGASKASFKRAVAALYKKKLVQPGPFTTKLM